ncbi:MAG: DUF3105 domain-containing protein [Chloroflexi bacterium]|nr:DUF3105 domain-containing protein [Chloroflexota bacterium]
MEGNKKESRRERARQRRQNQKLKSRVTGILALVAVAAAAWWGISSLNKPTTGVEQEPMESAQHVPVGTFVEYSTSPPTSGMHYDQALPAGFYDENSPEMEIPYPYQFALHAMEHGYVIIWYNCANYDGLCEELKSQLRALLAEDGAKVIAFPWEDMTEPVVATSWTWMQRFETLDLDGLRQYVKENRSHPRAPEWSVP